MSVHGITTRAETARTIAKGNAQGLRRLLAAIENRIEDAERIGWQTLAASYRQDEAKVRAAIATLERGRAA